MSKYKLNINILSTNVREINMAMQKITLVKSVGKGAGTPVAWVTFSPFETNIITWETEYGVYASSTTVQNGAQIQRTSLVGTAVTGTLNPFEEGTFRSPISGGKANAYSIVNKFGKQFTFGLTQTVHVNGEQFAGSPLNAVTALNQQTAIFEPVEKVAIFLEAQFNNGVVISDILSNGLTLDFTHTPELTIRYDESVGQFITA